MTKSTNPDEAAAGKPPRFQLQQQSFTEVAKEIRKLAVYSSVIVGLFGWTAKLGQFWTGAAAFATWLAIQVTAVVIESYRVYPKTPESEAQARPGEQGSEP